MTDTDPPAEAPPPKKRGKLRALAIAAALLGLGGGGAYAAFAMGFVGAAPEGRAKRDVPQLVRKGEEDPYAPPSEGEGDAAHANVDGEGGSAYRTSYYSFSDEFTSNLRNSSGLIQVSLAASTRRDGRVLLWLKKHELAERSAILAVLADTPEEDVYTIAGKARLQQRLTAAINKVLTDHEGFGGVDAVFFRTFLIQ